MIIRHVTVDCANPYELASWWSRMMTGWKVSDEDSPGDPEVLLEPPPGPASDGPPAGPGILFIRVPEAKSVKNRVHFDLMPTERTRDEEVERVIELGATLHEDHRRADGPGWVILLDPEGNEFCIERGRDER